MRPLGYFLALLGIVALALSQETLRKPFSITLPESLSSSALMIAGAVLIVIGLFFLAGKGNNSVSKKDSEVPIYEGNKIVGYRRT